jgi:hypothetical protein
MKNHPSKDISDKNYTLGYYSGFYSSLKDKIWANGGHFEFFVKIWSKLIIFTMLVLNESWNLESNDKLSKFFTSPKFNIFVSKTQWLYLSFLGYLWIKVSKCIQYVNLIVSFNTLMSFILYLSSVKTISENNSASTG